MTRVMRETNRSSFMTDEERFVVTRSSHVDPVRYAKNRGARQEGANNHSFVRRRETSVRSNHHLKG